MFVVSLSLLCIHPPIHPSCCLVKGGKEAVRSEEQHVLGKTLGCLGWIPIVTWRRWGYSASLSLHPRAISLGKRFLASSRGFRLDGAMMALCMHTVDAACRLDAGGGGKRKKEKRLSKLWTVGCGRHAFLLSFSFLFKRKKIYHQLCRWELSPWAGPVSPQCPLHNATRE